jgi:lysyl-tRNA synthetase class 2
VVAGTAGLFAGAGVLAAALVPTLLAPLALRPALPSPLHHSLVVLGGVGVLLIARGLMRGCRRAADLAICVLVATAAGGLAAGGPDALAAVEVALAGLLLVRRSSFSTGGGGRRSAGVAGAVAAGAVGAAYGVAVVGLLLADQVTGLGPALGASWSWLLAGTWWLESWSPLAIVLDGLVLVVLAAVILAIHGLLRPARAYIGHSPLEHERAAALLARHARDSLDPFALREDKTFHFSPDGFLAYQVVGETAVVSGDPVGAPGTAAAILSDFEAVAAKRGWDVVLTATSARELDAYRAAGFHVLQIGDEAVVDPRGFSLEGRARKSVRKAVGRVERHGWTMACVRGEALDLETMDELARVETAWRAAHPRLQGFAMTLGRLWGAPEDGDSLYVLGRDEHGALGAFLRFAAYPGGLSLDVMRRVSNEPNGVNEALVVAALSWAREHDVAEVSLNFAGFSHIMAPQGALTRGQRMLRAVLKLTRGRFQLDRIARFNDKFGPTWRPRHLVHRGAASLPRAGLRVLQAESYVRAPRARRLAGGWHPSEGPGHL